MTGKSKLKKDEKDCVVSDAEEEITQDTEMSEVVSKENNEDSVGSDCDESAKSPEADEKETSVNDETEDMVTEEAEEKVEDSEETGEKDEEDEEMSEDKIEIDEKPSVPISDQENKDEASGAENNESSEAEDKDDEGKDDEGKYVEDKDAEDKDAEDKDVEDKDVEDKDAEDKDVEDKEDEDKDDNLDERKEPENSCEITLDLSEDETMDSMPMAEKLPTAEEIQERLRRKLLLQEMEEKKIDYDSEDTIDITVDPEFDTEDEVVAESEKFKHYWKTVIDSPQDFTAWTYLLQLVEQEGQMALTRRAYNSFFNRYPLCYGYWKKFSEVERKKGNINRARKILERGVRAIPLSVDLWMHVTDFYIKHYQGPDAGVQKVRIIFKRAIKAAGEEFRSEKLWKKYINYELENKRFNVVLEIYDNILKVQTQCYQNHFVEFTDFVNNHNPADLLKEAEFDKALTEARENITTDSTKKPVDPLERGDSKSGDDELDEGPPGVEDHEKPPNEEELKHIRQQIIAKRKSVFQETEQSVTKIWNFEEGIKRPYFHVKQLERVQLKNWREYLDSEISRGNHHRIVLLFERCLIACALYEDFWLKYAKYMTDHNVDKARSIYQRACNIHLPKKPNIHVQWAAFEEINGDLETAAVILERLDKSLPGMATIKMRRVAVARRAGKLDEAENFLRSYVSSASKDKEQIFFTKKLAWFLYKKNKRDEARQLLKDLIKKHNGEVKLYSDLIEMEFHNANIESTEADEEKAMEAFDIALESESLTEDQKFSFSQKKLEFLEDFGLNVKRLQKAYDEHQKLSKQQKKRQSEQAAVVADQPPTKKAKTDTNGQIPVQVSAASTTLSNGARYSTSAVSSYTTSSSQPHAQTAYATGDAAAANYYSQNYWNYQQGKPTDQQQYNYQWGQYYGSR